MSQSSTWSLAPFHIISYGALLGTSTYQSFFNGYISYKNLPRPLFATLQTALTPVYFAIQTALPVIIALTYPASKQVGLATSSSSSVRGLLDVSNRWNALVPISTMFVCGALNLVLFGPWTTNIMNERYEQEAKDDKKHYDPGPHSESMQRLNKSFVKAHTASMLTNMLGLGAMIQYAFMLAKRMEL